MRYLHWLIHGNSLAHRVCVLGICIGLVVLSCLFHGARGSERVQNILDGMFEQDAVTGMFWRVSAVEEDAVVVTRYQRVLRIQWLDGEAVASGDRLSFVVRRIPGAEEWVPDELRVHGKAGLKYAVSFVAVVWVFFSCVLHVRLDRENAGLQFSQGRRPCRTD